jgi:predicted tellurium resistance membrane protein TerC
MSEMLFRPDVLFSLLSLTALETVLGIDNIIFLTLLVGKLPRSQQAKARRLGLVLALAVRILLLLTLSWLASLKTPWFFVAGHGISGRDLVLMAGGAFLLFKSTWELFTGLEAAESMEEQATEDYASGRKFLLTIVQIILMDIIFSLDSVITAVGLAPHVAIMITAMTLAMLAMLAFAKTIGEFVNRHPSMKVLALSFLVLIGTLLIAEGGGQKISKGYVYFAMAFSFSVELLNIRIRKRAGKVASLLHEPTMPSSIPSSHTYKIKELERRPFALEPCKAASF